MPHGAGFSGGHHGGHHGGGFTHHHHHHGHHHHHHVGSAYWGGPYYRYGHRRRSLFWGIFWLSVIGIAVALAVVFSLRFGAPQDNSSTNLYAPNETRSVHYSTVLCQSITAKYDRSESDYDSSATFYILRETPPLDDHDELSFSQREFFSGYLAYNYWSYYLYPGSTIHASVCKEDSVTMKFYLIKGKGKFNNWVDEPRSKYALDSRSIGAVCPDRFNYTYDVTTEGEYYLVYHLESFSSTHLSASFDFERKKYTVDPNNVISNCSLHQGSTTCYLDVAMDSNVGLVSVDPSSDLTGQASLSFYCGARIWVYSVISVTVVAVIMVVVVGIIAVCCCYMRRNKKKYTPITDNNESTPVSTAPAPSTATYVTGTQPPPPPYNPSYGGTDQPPKYY